MTDNNDKSFFNIFYSDFIVIIFSFLAFVVIATIISMTVIGSREEGMASGLVIGLALGLGSGQLKEDKKKIKGLWCYPFTRNRTLNNQWKKNLKTWKRQHANFNGIVFRLTREDFPLYAGHFIATGVGDQALMSNMGELKQLMNDFPSKGLIDKNEDTIDTDEFEIVLLSKVRPERIIKIIKDRDGKKNYRQHKK